MPQQINLFTPLLLTPKRYFSARTMAVALGVFVLLGSALVAFGVGRIHLASTALESSVAAQATELTRLRNAAVDAGGGAGGANELALRRELDAAAVRLKSLQRELADLRMGLLEADLRHSARLNLVARTIPARAWMTRLELDGHGMKIEGFTLEPASLNAWVADLARSPALQGHALAQVEVARVAGVAAGVDNNRPVPGNGSAALAQRDTWAFSLVSVRQSLESEAAR